MISVMSFVCVRRMRIIVALGFESADRSHLPVAMNRQRASPALRGGRMFREVRRRVHGSNLIEKRKSRQANFRKSRLFAGKRT